MKLVEKKRSMKYLSNGKNFKAKLNIKSLGGDNEFVCSLKYHLVGRIRCLGISKYIQHLYQKIKVHVTN